MGMTTGQTPFGHTVPVYDMERTICDLIRSRSRIEIQVFQSALKQYARRRDKNLRTLMQYAAMFHVEKKCCGSIWRYFYNDNNGKTAKGFDPQPFKKKSADAQILMRNYMMERFLERIALSDYKDRFILKGGMLVAAMVGLDARATMDMDATIKRPMSAWRMWKISYLRFYRFRWRTVWSFA